MNWIPLNDVSQLDDIIRKSTSKPQIIFKHSNRCSISAMAKNRLDKASATDDVDVYFLDLLQYRVISNKVAELFDVYHESPQILVITNGKCVYDESHMGIQWDEVMENINTGSAS